MGQVGQELRPLEHAGLALAWIDSEGRITSWTTAFSGHFEGNELAPRDPLASILPNITASHLGRIWQAVRDGKRQIVHLVSSGENPYPLVLELSPVADESGIVAVALMRRRDRLTASTGAETLRGEVLERVAARQDLHEVMNHVCLRVEAIAPEVTCSILRIDGGRVLRHLAAPSLPADFATAIDGVEIGPAVGSCGTAAWRGEPVVVTDIATDPLWADFKHLALGIGYHACWSTPIKDKDGRPLSTFALYYRTPRAPSSFEQELVEYCVHVCSIAIAQTEAREQVQKLAFYDETTGLPNRELFKRRSAEIVAAGTDLALHYIDLDHFKLVNDNLGHAAGDELLRVVGERLRSCVGETDVLARLGGDEFAVLQDLDGVRDPGKAAAVLAGGMISALEDPAMIEGHYVDIGISVGFAVAPRDGTELDTLMKRADLALYRAKADGRRTMCAFYPQLATQAGRRRQIEEDLRTAIDREELTLVFQPIFDSRSLDVASFEALVRWTHEERGPVGPAEFIPIAEESGLINQISEWVLRRACRAAAKWPAPTRISVNLSPIELRRPYFPLRVIETLGETGLAPDRLELEVTETAVMTRTAETIVSLDLLQRSGISVALDDFGTGYSSLSNLRGLRFDSVKIDRSFVAEMVRDRNCESIIRATVALAKALDAKVTAEGVETEEQHRRLAEIGCDRLQGYLLGRPMSEDEAMALLAGGPDRQEIAAG